MLQKQDGLFPSLSSGGITDDLPIIIHITIQLYCDVHYDGQIVTIQPPLSPTYLSPLRDVFTNENSTKKKKKAQHF